MRYLPSKHLAFLVALILSGLSLVACGGSDNYYEPTPARINAMCPKTGIAQTSIAGGDGWEKVVVTCKSGKAGSVSSWDNHDIPVEGGSNSNLPTVAP